MNAKVGRIGVDDIQGVNLYTIRYHATSMEICCWGAVSGANG
ncbi:MAG: hypothetical protein OXE78_07940 [Gammaproteobacteria bacterium]|nr:hypothetical protein [Gammaproteobacteria bacterium]MCY4356753.1 hypothetical protein [Gammaproteobacteria bacterium]